MAEFTKRNIRNVSLYCTDYDAVHLEKIFERAGIHDARSLLVTNFDGIITDAPNPIAGTKLTLGDMWYIQNVMMLQRLQVLDDAMAKLKEKGII